MYDTTQYFDEMNILRQDKINRITTANKFIDEMLEFFAMQLADILSGTFLYDDGKHTEDYEEKLTNIYMKMASLYEKDNLLDSRVAVKAADFARYVEESTERAVENPTNAVEEYVAARLTGLKISEENVPNSVMRMFNMDRASNIALNETNWIFNYMNHLELSKNQLVHTWQSMKDERVRQSHWLADGQTVPIHEPFIVNGYRMLFPMDDSFGAPISEIIGCRCIEI